MSRVPDDDTIRTGVRVRMITATAIVSAGLAPIVDELVLGDAMNEPRMSSGTLLYGAWAALLGAIGGGLVMRIALDRRSPLHVLWLATLAGILHPPFLIPQLILDSESPVLTVLAVVALGAAVSAPVGLGFGAVFLAGLAGVHADLTTPTRATRSRTWLAIARLFAAAAAVALLLSLWLGGSYCQLVFYVLLPALGLEAPPGTDLEWTRLLVLPAPFALAALSAWLVARREEIVSPPRAEAVPETPAGT
ncbi:MAG: hypothetical protein J0L92_18370 [Deltaproteobacteria bacterium]|nr:hypothetical protein [Deltaproteobacteria bacterium]